MWTSAAVMFVIQHFCDIVFVLSSYDYDGLCYIIDLDPCLSVTHQRSYLYKIYLYKTYNKESPIVIEIKLQGRQAFLISLNKALLASDMLYNITFNNIEVIQVSPSYNSIVKFIYYI